MAELTLYGNWINFKYVADNPDNNFIVYRRYQLNGIADHTKFNLSYTKSTGLWSEGPGTGVPVYLNSVDNFSTASSGYLADAVTIYGYDPNGDLQFYFTSPWYAPPPEEPATGTEGSVDCSLTYNAAENHMQVFLDKDFPTSDMLSTRNLYYRVRNATIDNVSTDRHFHHTSGTNTYYNFDPTVPGTWQLEKVLTNPLEVLICDSAAVTQSNIDAYNAANTPPNTPRRRGNLNFW